LGTGSNYGWLCEYMNFGKYTFFLITTPVEKVGRHMPRNYFTGLKPAPLMYLEKSADTFQETTSRGSNLHH
jgi:hypothetical protein